MMSASFFGFTFWATVDEHAGLCALPRPVTAVAICAIAAHGHTGTLLEPKTWKKHDTIAQYAHTTDHEAERPDIQEKPQLSG